VGFFFRSSIRSGSSDSAGRLAVQAIINNQSEKYEISH
jgi:hypothetical protein